MFKYIFSLFLILNIALLSNAQEFNGGLFGGMATSQISGDSYSGFNKVGIYAGVFVNRYFNQHWGLQMEIDFIQKGSRKNPDYDNNDYSSYLLRLNYIEVPIIVKYEYNKYIGFELGPSVGYLVNFVEDVNDGNPNQSKEFNNPELALLVGLSYQFVKNTKFTVRYSFSILPVRNHASDQTYYLNKGQYNHVLSFTFHRQFNFNR